MKNKIDARVAVITSTYAREADDYQVPWMRELIARTKNQVADIRVFAPSFKGLKSHKIDGIKVHRFRYAPYSIESLTHDEGAPSKTKKLSSKLLAIPYLLFGIVAIFLWCLRYRVNVLHVHWPFPHGVWAILPKYLLGVKVIAMCHGAELAIARRSKGVSLVLAILLRMADVRCANSSHTANEILKVSGMHDTRIMPYGATVAVNEVAKNEEGIPTLLFCGRLVQRKGIDVLLEALPDVLLEQEVQVVITGEGDCKQEWIELAESLGVKSKVCFTGFVSNEELASLYSNCTAYIHPAIYDENGDTEGLGVVLIEALSYKKPVIASAVGGIVDVVLDGKTGILVEEKKPKELAHAILDLLADPKKADILGQQGFKHVQELFDWSRIADKTTALYARVHSMGVKS